MQASQVLAPLTVKASSGPPSVTSDRVASIFRNAGGSHLVLKAVPPGVIGGKAGVGDARHVADPTPDHLPPVAAPMTVAVNAFVREERSTKANRLRISDEAPRG